MSNKLREALKNSNGLLVQLSLISEWSACARKRITENQKALTEPLRNCDVGTAEEQNERFENFCQSYYEPCNVDGECWRCPLFRTKTRCPIAWGQMPYTEGESK